ncbi:MAG: family 43 glycosylhydrolase [Singulisphaera sp.]
MSDPAELFSIDGAWLLDDDGRLYLFRCLDFTTAAEPPHGTGIVVQPMLDPLTTAGPPATVLRAHSPWQLFQADRTMPLYGGRTFATWNTIEGPAPVRRAGRFFCGYSGGNYAGAYGTGEAIADHPLGPYTDLRGENGPIFGTTPGLVEGPGHFSVVRPDLVHDWIVLHGRTPGEHVRRVWLCPASWDREGVTIGPLTDAPQPSPPLPTDLSRFDGPPGPPPPGWRIGSGAGTPAGDGLRQADRSAREALARREADHAGRFLGRRGLDSLPRRRPRRGRAGRPGAGCGTSIVIKPDELRWEATGPDGAKSSHPLPTLGAESFDPKAYHVLEIRAESGRAEARLDGVRLPGAWSVAGPDARLGLFASGVADFDAVAITNRSDSDRS